MSLSNSHYYSTNQSDTNKCDCFKCTCTLHVHYTAEELGANYTGMYPCLFDVLKNNTRQNILNILSMPNIDINHDATGNGLIHRIFDSDMYRNESMFILNIIVDMVDFDIYLANKYSETVYDVVIQSGDVIKIDILKDISGRVADRRMS